MKKYAKAENGKARFIQIFEEGNQPSGWVEVDDTVAIGDDFDGTTFTPAQRGPTDAERIAALREVTIAHKADIAERMIADNPDKAGELDAWAMDHEVPARAAALFAGLPLGQRARAKNSNEIPRNSPLIAGFAALYGYDTPEAVDALFGIE